MSATWVLLHGTPLSPAVWEAVASRLPGDVITPWVELAEGESVDDLADRLIADLPAVGPIHLVGHSFGGQVALAMALRAPERMEFLALLCSRDTPFPSFHPLAEAVRRGDPIDVDQSLSRWFRAEQIVSGDPVIDYARTCLLGVDREVWARALDAIATFDRSAQTPGLTVPTRAIAAELDSVSTVSAMTDLVARLPRGELTLLPGAGHMSMFLTPLELENILLAPIEDGDGPPP